MATQLLMTADEFEMIAHTLGVCELVRGEVVNLSPGGFVHSNITAKLVLELGKWNERGQHGYVLTCEMGIMVQRAPDTVRGADVAYYSSDRLPADNMPDGFCAVPPNLVVEVTGKGQGWRDMVEKTSEYLRMGVDRVWVIDPRTKRVHVFRADNEPVILSDDDTLADADIIPGFTCKVANLFAS